MQEIQAKRILTSFGEALECLHIPAKALQLTSGIKLASLYN